MEPVDHVRSKEPSLTDWLRGWLSQAASEYRGATRFDYAAGSPHETVDRRIAALIVRSRSDPFRTRRLLDRLGWQSAGARLQPSRTAQKRHGDFGEVLAVAILKEFQDIDVPVVKLRYQIDPEQTQPGTDIVGFIFSESGDSIDRLEFVEVKVRTSRGANTVRDAHQQLLEDVTTGFVETLDFLHQRITDDNPNLLDMFEDYLADERDGRLDSYRISVVVDPISWKEEWLDKLPDKEDLVRPLTIDICRIEDLQELITRSWDAVQPDVIVELTDHAGRRGKDSSS